MVLQLNKLNDYRLLRCNFNYTNVLQVILYRILLCIRIDQFLEILLAIYGQKSYKDYTIKAITIFPGTRIDVNIDIATCKWILLLCLPNKIPVQFKLQPTDH